MRDPKTEEFKEALGQVSFFNTIDTFIIKMNEFEKNVNTLMKHSGSEGENGRVGKHFAETVGEKSGVCQGRQNMTHPTSMSYYIYIPYLTGKKSGLCHPVTSMSHYNHISYLIGKSPVYEKVGKCHSSFLNVCFKKSR